MRIQMKHVIGSRLRAMISGLTCTSLLGGCIVGTDSMDDLALSENVASSEQALVLELQWKPTYLQSQTAGMSVSNGGITYTWSTNQDPATGLWRACRGNAYDTTCNVASWWYKSPIHASFIRGIGFHRTDGKVYTWFKAPGAAGFWSKGTSSDLGSVSIAAFTPPVGASMDGLIDAEHTTDQGWVFYWRMSNGTIRRSNSLDPAWGGTLQAGNVSAFPLNALDIAGILGHSASGLLTYYQKDNVNSFPVTLSNDPMSLL